MTEEQRQKDENRHNLQMIMVSQLMITALQEVMQRLPEMRLEIDYQIHMERRLVNKYKRRIEKTKKR